VALNLVGVLPVSGINLGLALAPPVLQAELTRLQLDLSNLGIAIEAQAKFSINKPDFTALLATLQALQVAVQAFLNTPIMVTAGASVNADAVLQLGLIDLALDLVVSLEAKLSVGLNAGGLASWTYSGPCSGLVSASPAMNGGWTKGVVVATENVGSWGQFGASINTGASATAQPHGPAVFETLGRTGGLGGSEIFVGLLDIAKRIELFKIQLQGLKVALQLQIQVSLGLQLPDPSEILALIAQLMQDVMGLFNNLINVSLNLHIELQGIQLRIEALLALIVSIGLQLSAGGLALWTYTGQGTLGSDVADSLAGGIPGGSGANADIRALIVAAEDPDVWGCIAPLLGGVA
jgi:hypothetical protein